MNWEFGDVLVPTGEYEGHPLIVMYVGRETEGEPIFTVFGVKDEDGLWAGQLNPVHDDDWRLADAP